MDWLNEWAKYEVIGKWIGLGLLALALLGFLIFILIIAIKERIEK